MTYSDTEPTCSYNCVYSTSCATWCLYHQPRTMWHTVMTQSQLAATIASTVRHVQLGVCITSHEQCDIQWWHRANLQLQLRLQYVMCNLVFVSPATNNVTYSDDTEPTCSYNCVYSTSCATWCLYHQPWTMTYSDDTEPTCSYNCVYSTSCATWCLQHRHEQWWTMFTNLGCTFHVNMADKNPVWPAYIVTTDST